MPNRKNSRMSIVIYALELTNLKSLARLERLAKETYNMAPAEPQQVVNLR